MKHQIFIYPIACFALLACASGEQTRPTTPNRTAEQRAEMQRDQSQRDQWQRGQSQREQAQREQTQREQAQRDQSQTNPSQAEQAQRDAQGVPVQRVANRPGDDVTAENQSNTDIDAQITQNIRRSLIADGRLGMMAQNVTIVTQGRNVTLRGRVSTGLERNIIETHVREQTAVKRVQNDIEVSE